MQPGNFSWEDGRPSDAGERLTAPLQGEEGCDADASRPTPRELPPKGFLPEVRLFGISVHRRKALFLLGDLAVLLLSTYLGHLLRWFDDERVRSLKAILDETTGGSLLFVGLSLLLLYVLDCYSIRLDFRTPGALFRLAAAIGFASIFQMAAYYMAPQWRWYRGETLFSFAILMPAMLLWRAAASAYLTKRLGPSPVLVVGSGARAEAIAHILEDHEQYGHGYSLVGFVSDRPEGVPADSSVLGSARALREIVREHRPREVIVADRESLSSEMGKALLGLKQTGLAITDFPSAYRRLTGRVPVSDLRDAWVIFGPSFSGVDPIYRGLLRLLDVLVAITGLVLSLPILLASAAAIKLTSRGPVLFVQERVGLNERSFRLLKLRTMEDNAEARTGPVWSPGASDSRVTRVGRFLRRSRIDEIPQLWNVLRGEMSMVGPRPERPVFVAQLKEKIPYYSLRFAVKPGITGWAQVRYGYGASDEAAMEKLQHDLYAVQEMSPILYVLILLKTVKTVLSRPGS